MAKIGQSDILSRFKKIELSSVKLGIDYQSVEGLFTLISLQPENFKPAEHDPNDIFVVITHEQKKKKNVPQIKSSQAPIIKLGKPESQNSNPSLKEEQQQSPQHQSLQEEKQKVYRPGPFALFYELNEGKLNKEEPVWYYKDNKNVVGPVSSYNMDKMAYFKTVQEDTKVAFKSVDKFVKFKKIKEILAGEKERKE